MVGCFAAKRKEGTIPDACNSCHIFSVFSDHAPANNSEGSETYGHAGFVTETLAILIYRADCMELGKSMAPSLATALKNTEKRNGRR